MKWLGSAALLLAVVALSACGTAENERAQPAGSLEPAPPIEAIDQPAPPLPFDSRPDGVEASTYICTGADVPGECTPTPEQIAEAEESARRYREAVAPAEDSKPRAFARLRITPRGPATTATMIAWTARSGKLCTGFAVGEEDIRGARGPCVPGNRSREACADLCLELSGEGSTPEFLYLLTGTVTSRAEDLRITFPNGQAIRYPLEGPIVPDFPEYRAFMLDLGTQRYRRLELLRDGEVIERSEVPQRQLDFDRCARKFPIPPPGAAEAGPEGPDPELQACLRKASTGAELDG
jgi:hypothetical protein